MKIAKMGNKKKLNEKSEIMSFELVKKLRMEKCKRIYCIIV